MICWRKGMGLIFLAITAVAGLGCAVFVAAGAGVAVGVGAAEYINGELKQAYAAPMGEAWNASLAAVEGLKMKTTEKSIDNLDLNRQIKGETYEGKNFQISLEALSKEVTVVKVRIGVFGDEKYSRKIQEVIAANLKR